MNQPQKRGHGAPIAVTPARNAMSGPSRTTSRQSNHLPDSDLWNGNGWRCCTAWQFSTASPLCRGVGWNPCPATTPMSTASGSSRCGIFTFIRLLTGRDSGLALVDSRDPTQYFGLAPYLVRADGTPARVPMRRQLGSAAPWRSKYSGPLRA